MPQRTMQRKRSSAAVFKCSPFWVFSCFTLVAAYPGDGAHHHHHHHHHHHPSQALSTNPSHVHCSNKNDWRSLYPSLHARRRRQSESCFASSSSLQLHSQPQPPGLRMILYQLRGGEVRNEEEEEENDKSKKTVEDENSTSTASHQKRTHNKTKKKKKFHRKQEQRVLADEIPKNSTTVLETTTTTTTTTVVLQAEDVQLSSSSSSSLQPSSSVAEAAPLDQEGSDESDESPGKVGNVIITSSTTSDYGTINSNEQGRGDEGEEVTSVVVNIPTEGEGEDDARRDEETELQSSLSLQEEASILRVKGKELHDDGYYAEAAELFQKAANNLLEAAAGGGEGVSGDGDDVGDHHHEDFATCRLHEALCRIKAGGAEEAEGAVRACGDVLEKKDKLPNVLVARAFHRRAKAFVELENMEEALRDARSAAFLGDRKAVALYGKLMRDHQGESGNNINRVESSTESALLDLLTSSASSKSGSDSSSSVGSPLDINASLPPFLPSLFNMAGKSNNGGDSSLAKSILSSISKRLQDTGTQNMICTFLQQTSPMQLQALAGSAGFPLAEKQANQLTNFCHGVTPLTLQKFIRTTKRITYVVRLIQKVARLLTKYRSILIIICLLAWIKSALLRPLPLSRVARRAALEAAKKAAASSSATLMP